MFDPSRPISRWSTSISDTPKPFGYSKPAASLRTVRKKLLQQSTTSQKTLPHRMAKSKQDVEELFKLYYSNDIKYDAFQRQIVTGTRIPPAQASTSNHNNLGGSSTASVFNSKHCVSREEWDASDKASQDQHLLNNEPTFKSLPTKRSVQFRIDDASTIHSKGVPFNPKFSPRTTISVASSVQETLLPIRNNEIHDLKATKNIQSTGNTANEFIESVNSKRNKTHFIQRSILSKESLDLRSALHASGQGQTQPQPTASVSTASSLDNTANSRKDPMILSATSFSTLNSLQQNNQQTVITGSAFTVRQRSPKKYSTHRQRTKSNTTTASTSPQDSCIKGSSPPTTYSPLSMQTEPSELPVFIGAQRVVSIPSKCSRYVLVTFPEVPLRYNTPSYIERLLLPERFPNLFQNIVQSYSPHLTNVQQSKTMK